MILNLTPEEINLVRYALNFLEKEVQLNEIQLRHIRRTDQKIDKYIKLADSQYCPKCKKVYTEIVLTRPLSKPKKDIKMCSRCDNIWSHK